MFISLEYFNLNYKANVKKKKKKQKTKIAGHVIGNVIFILKGTKIKILDASTLYYCCI